MEENIKFKSKKKTIVLILAFIFLLLTILIISVTYARYISSLSIKSYIELGRWRILVNSQNILENSDISEVVTAVFEDNEYINSGVIVPTSKGHIDINIDYTDVTVPFTYELTLNPNTETPLEDFKVINYSIDETSFTYKDSKIFNYIDPKTATSNIQTVRLNFEWFEGESENFDDIEDTNFAHTYDNFKYNINISFTQLADTMIGEAINAEKYGEEVIGYECANLEAQKEAGGWRLFYQNNEFTYLISELIIKTDYRMGEECERAGYIDKTGADVSSIGQNLNPMFKKAGGFTSNNTRDSIKLVGWLADPEYWQKYKNEDSIFAIGGPSLELFVASYYQAGEKAKDGRKPLCKLEVKDGGYIYEKGSYGLSNQYNHGIYQGTGKGNLAFPLCSPYAEVSNELCRSLLRADQEKDRC